MRIYYEYLKFPNRKRLHYNNNYLTSLTDLYIYIEVEKSQKYAYDTSVPT